MRILDVLDVKGRGTLAVLDTAEVPVGDLRIGGFVTQGDRSWIISGVEMVDPPSSSDKVGVLVRGEGRPEPGEAEVHRVHRVHRPSDGGILSGLSIKEAVADGRIEIDPWEPTHVNPEDRINPASYDLTLGRFVAVYEKVVYVDFEHGDGGVPGERVSPNLLVGNRDFYLDAASPNQVVRYEMDERGFLLKPGVGYLMHTAERIKTDHYVPIVDGKSSIGRLFVTAHVTAGYGDPGYDGQYTLEVVAVHPTVVYPGMRFCQMRFHTVIGGIESYASKGSYKGDLAEGPVPSQSWRSFRGRGAG